MKQLNIIGRMAARAAGLSGLFAGFALALAPAAQAQTQTRTEIVPYLEVQQVISADLSDDDVLTYTALAAGIDGRVKTRRLEAQISYRYERRIPWEGHLSDQDVHSGLAMAHFQLMPEVSIDAGAIAARSRIDSRGPAFGFSTGDDANIAEVYGAFAGPTLSTQVGPLDVNAAYRIGYVHVDDHGLRGIPRTPGEPLDRYSSSTSHNATLSVGMGPGALPFGWTVGAGYVREDTDRLDQEFEAKYIRGDIVVPVTPALAVTAGVGYEEIESSQHDILRDAAGLPVLTPGGRLIADRTAPRLFSLGIDGVIWDAGIIWRPSARTELQARVGRRYGGTSITGSFQHQLNSAYSVNVQVYDSVQSFGRLLLNDLSGLPVDFKIDRNGLDSSIGGIGGCVFGADPGTGACFDDVFQSISTANFRNRGITAMLSGGRGPWSVGVGAGYNQRKYFTPRGEGTAFRLDGVKDHSFTLNGYASRQLSRTSEVGLDVYAAWFDTGLRGSGDVFATGITGSYRRSLVRDRLQFQAALGLYTTDSDFEDSTVASALVGLRYQF